MESKDHQKIELENNQMLVISDMSKKIAADACVVRMQADMEIKIEKTLFPDNLVSDSKLKAIQAILGEKVTYKYKIERNFIMDHEKEEVFESLVKTFMDNMGKYISHPDFPGKFILKEYKKKQK